LLRQWFVKLGIPAAKSASKQQQGVHTMSDKMGHSTMSSAVLLHSSFHLYTGLRPFVPPTANLQRTLATRLPLWPQHWSFSSAVSTDRKVTVTHVITDRQSNAGGAMFAVLGDASGRLYFFTADGNLLYEHDTGECRSG
jgi:hypothetical protein